MYSDEWIVKFSIQMVNLVMWIVTLAMQMVNFANNSTLIFSVQQRECLRWAMNFFEKIH